MELEYRKYATASLFAVAQMEDGKMYPLPAPRPVRRNDALASRCTELKVVYIKRHLSQILNSPYQGVNVSAACDETIEQWWCLVPRISISERARTRGLGTLVL
ncbi:hypothetical protein FBU30_010870 [Linnemannia zychae]|nr:hypothetical protein FBU30_010870 [Linnemannia zychae]